MNGPNESTDLIRIYAGTSRVTCTPCLAIVHCAARHDERILRHAATVETHSERPPNVWRITQAVSDDLSMEERSASKGTPYRVSNERPSPRQSRHRRKPATGQCDV